VLHPVGEVDGFGHRGLAFRRPAEGEQDAAPEGQRDDVLAPEHAHRLQLLGHPREDLQAAQELALRIAECAHRGVGLGEEAIGAAEVDPVPLGKRAIRFR
jgi:hypothetical protein